MRRYAIKRWMAVTVCLLASIGPAMAAEPLLQMLPDALLDEAAQELRSVGDDVDWVRRVRVNEAALAADELTVDLHDTVLHLVRDPTAPLFEDARHVIYRPTHGEHAHREVRTLSGLQWVGRVKLLGPGVEATPGQSRPVRIWSDASGTHARFSYGFWNYALDGDRLVKRDVRRARRDERDDVRDRRPDRPAPDLPAERARHVCDKGSRCRYLVGPATA